MVFCQRTLLEQNTPLIQHENGNRLVAQPAPMDIQLFDRLKLAIDPSGNKLWLHLFGPFITRQPLPPTMPAYTQTVFRKLSFARKAFDPSKATAPRESR